MPEDQRFAFQVSGFEGDEDEVSRKREAMVVPARWPVEKASWRL